MPDCGWDVKCLTENALESAFDEIARDAAGAAGELIANSFTWWVRLDSVNPDSEIVRNLQQYTIPIALLVLTASVLVQSIRMVLSRKKDPAINIGLGLIRYVVVTTIGLSLLAAVLRAGDEWSGWLVDQAVANFAERMRTVLMGDGITNTFLLLLVALIGAIFGLIQWVIAAFAQAGILVLSVMLPLAASGSMNDSTKVWLNRMVPWLLSLAFYKPMAAMIYAVAFTFFADGEDLTTMMYGLMAMFCSAIAMPAMMKFFAWSQTTITSGSGAGGVLAAGATGATSMAALQSSRAMQLTGPGSGPSGAASGAAGSGSTGSGSASSGSTGGAASSGSDIGKKNGQAFFSGSAGWTQGSGPTGAAGGSDAGAPTSRTGGGVPPSTGAAAASGTAATGAAAVQAAYQAGQAAADRFTQGGGQQQ